MSSSRPSAADTGMEVDVDGFLDGSMTPAVLVARLVEAGLERAGAGAGAGAAGPASPAAARWGGKPHAHPPEPASSTSPAPVEAVECVLAEFDK
jgi:hypothetical protein